LRSNIALRCSADVGYSSVMAAVSFDLPNELMKQLQSSGADVAAEAKEALAVKLFREHKLNHRQLSELLGLDRLATDGVLKRHEAAKNWSRAGHTGSLLGCHQTQPTPKPSWPTKPSLNS